MTDINVTVEEAQPIEVEITSGGGVSAHSQLSGLDADDHTQYSLADGTRAFTGVVGGVTPTSSAHLATKGYADSIASGLDWQESVESLGDNDPPGAPDAGDRYVVGTSPTGAWVGHEDEITEWDGSSWDFTALSEGQALWVEDVDINYVYNGSAWVVVGSTQDHGALTGLGDDDHPQYHNDSRADTWLATKTTTNLTEGTNLYYTNARARAALSGTAPIGYDSGTGAISLNYDSNDFQLSGNDLQILDSGIDHGSLAGLADDDHTQYFNTVRANAWLATKTTDNLTEGSSNLYFTEARARSALSATSPLDYDSGTGVISFDKFADSEILIFGDDSDIQASFDGSAFSITGTSGDISIISTDSSGSIILKPNNDASDYFKFSVLSDVPSLFGVGAYVRIGDAGATSHSLDSEDDLLVSGELEVDGASYFDDDVHLPDSKYIYLGSDDDTAIRHDDINMIVSNSKGNMYFTNTDASGEIYLRPNSDQTHYFYLRTISGVPSIYGQGAYLRIGDAAATSHSLDSEDDLMVSGELEVDGTAYFDGSVYFDGSLTMVGDTTIYSSSNGDITFSPDGEGLVIVEKEAQFEYNVQVGGTLRLMVTSPWSGLPLEFFDASSTPNRIVAGFNYYPDDGLKIAVYNNDGYCNNNLILTRWSSTNHDHTGASANPTFFIHSDLDPDTNNTRWGSLAHTGTEVAAGQFEIKTGAGDILLQPASGGYVILNSSKSDTGDPTGSEGMIYINTFDNVVKIYADGGWRTIASGW